ncbi:uncharacterized protein N7496_012305 [Penicillium cataractarum]|uniref:CHAT domain-containing protein n=1 Tax=Penicillium cataractarum TaxID=2100454 RepID=A0A9W9RCQ3_9EURO|nr:uncharacterized protein N7496_012305 [Penicillium cataractarum]KAJ5355093.1 hypothetical protein N7496_012305 [Penicillium cataractarum]
MPTTPGLGSLYGVYEENSAIQDVIETHNNVVHDSHELHHTIYTTKAMKNPTQKATLTELTAQIVHFASHGVSDPTDLSESHLLLQKPGSSGPVVDALKASSISTSTSLGRAWIAYLSAFSTAQVRADTLLDENIHLTSAFHVAGFAHVIGTLWRADEDACVLSARCFYRYLIGKGDIGESGAVARALREAVLELHRAFADRPNAWAPFVHFGA